MKGILTLLLLTVFSINSNANHLVGGELFYSHDAGDNYTIYLRLYRDCHSDGAQFDPTAAIGLYGANGFLYEIIDLTLPSTPSIAIIPFQNAACNSYLDDNPPCLEYVTYVGYRTISQAPFDYILSYQRCCFDSSLVNIVQPESAGFTLQTRIKSGIINSSPFFTQLSVFATCTSEFVQVDHSAIDLDGDSLVYRLDNVLGGGSSSNPVPNPPSGPPYTNHDWQIGYSTQQPLGVSSAISIDSQGLLSYQANNDGFYILAISVDEYRNSILIGTTTRVITVRSFGTLSVKQLNENEKIHCYPNPFADFVTIENAVGKKLNLSDLRGNILQTFTPNSEKEIIDFGHLEGGMYFISSNETGLTPTFCLIK